MHMPVLVSIVCDCFQLQQQWGVTPERLYGLQNLYTIYSHSSQRRHAGPNRCLVAINKIKGTAFSQPTVLRTHSSGKLESECDVI